MQQLLRMITRPLKVFRHQPWSVPNVITQIDSKEPIEEERSPYYNPSCYYPAQLGEILHGRYQIVNKLGHGSRATVWLAKDLHQWRWLSERYVALKINSNDVTRNAAGDAEVAILRHVSEVNRWHTGWHFVRKLRDSFLLESPAIGGRPHACLVCEPLREPIGRYCGRWQDDVLPIGVCKVILQVILEGLDYLHSECHVIHTDLKPDNIMVKLEDLALLSQAALDEYKNPLPQKHCEDGRIIYQSRKEYGPLRKPTGLVEIVDFDLAGRGDQAAHDGCIQAEVYRAPEVILDRGYSYSADIWSLGVMLWDLLEGRTLFQAVDPHVAEKYDDETHLAYITALLGPVPKDMLRNGKRTPLFYTPDGTLQNPSLVPKDFSFESTVKNMGPEQKLVFVSFVRRMITWRPEERSTAKELLSDPWFKMSFPED